MRATCGGFGLGRLLPDSGRQLAVRVGGLSDAAGPRADGCAGTPLGTEGAAFSPGVCLLSSRFVAPVVGLCCFPVL